MYSCSCGVSEFQNRGVIATKNQYTIQVNDSSEVTNSAVVSEAEGLIEERGVCACVVLKVRLRALSSGGLRAQVGREGRLD